MGIFDEKEQPQTYVLSTHNPTGAKTLRLFGFGVGPRTGVFPAVSLVAAVSIFRANESGGIVGAQTQI